MLLTSLELNRLDLQPRRSSSIKGLRYLFGLFPCARLSPSWRGQDPFRVYTEAGGDSWQTAILLSEHT
jgi:hypothetical protein